MRDIDGTDIGGFHFMGTGTYEFRSEDEMQQYARTTRGRSLVKDYLNDKGSNDDPTQKKDK